MYALIATRYLGRHFVLRQGSPQGMAVPTPQFRQLQAAADHRDPVPDWLAVEARRLWGVEVAGRPMADTVLVRADSPYRYGRASYELYLGCNYDCEHCYLGLKRFEGLDWPDRQRLLHVIRDAGVV